MLSVLEPIISALINTPWSVWFVLVYLLHIGIKATKNRSLHPLKLFVVPIMFILVNYKLILLKSSGAYLIYLSAGFLFGYLFGLKAPISVLRDLKRIELPGNYYTVTLLMLFFITKYTLGYLAATEPSNIAQYSFIDIAISGLVSGFFIGKSACYLIRYFAQEKNYTDA